jgi:hypothetical protein
MAGGWISNRRVTLLTLVIALTGCSDAREVGGPSVEPQPAAAVVGTNGASYDLLKGTFPDPSGNGASCDLAGQEPTSRLQSAAWIDSRGGELVISGGVVAGRAVGHVLTVPAQTVSSPTLFCMRLVATNHMQVQLLALTLDAKGKVVNVGAAGFRQPVLLRLSYAPLNLQPTQARYLAVVYNRGDGAPVEPMRMTGPPSLYSIQAALEHFSVYALAFSKYAMAVD